MKKNNTNHNKKYLVVDLDNTLIKIDLFKENLIRQLFINPLNFFKAIFLLFNNISRSKEYIAKKRANISALPYNNEIIETIKHYKQKGYKIVLATGADDLYAEQISKELSFFDMIISSNKNKNNIGKVKLESIIKKIGKKFIYVGDSSKDIPIWTFCKKAIIVGSKKKLLRELYKLDINIIKVIENKKNHVKNIFKQIRIHQWSKNSLIFLPALTSYTFFDKGIFINCCIGFLSFSLIASSIYILNDIIDVNNDRLHHLKRMRPLANGDISIEATLIIFFIFLIIGLKLSHLIGFNFLCIILLYIILNLLYSNFFKKILIADAIMLMLFYLIRIFSGHIPNSIPLSSWLFAFAMFLFFSLGLLKRFIDIDIKNSDSENSLFGRAYSSLDKNIIMSLGISSGIVSALVLMLYTSSESVQIFYNSPFFLILLAPIILYWISKMWLLANRGKINSDPVLFAVKNIDTYLVLMFSLIIVTISKYLTL